MTPEHPAAPAGTQFDLPAARRQLAGIAARGLAVFAAAFGAVLLLISLGQLAFTPDAPGLAQDRVGLALLLMAGAAAGGVLVQRGHARAASMLMVAVFGMGVALHGWMIGLGLFTTALAGLCLLVAVAGLLLGVRAAVALTLMYALLVVALAWAEAAGHIRGRDTLLLLPLADRVMGHTMLGAAGLLAAVLLNRR